MKKETFVVKGMTCHNCESTINKSVRQLKGVKNAFAHYETGKLDVTYDDSKVTVSEIEQVIAECGYKSSNSKEILLQRLIIFLIIGIVLLIIENTMGIMMLINAIPLAEENQSFAMLFVIGLLTSFHCVAMCGGLVLSQTVKRDDEKSKPQSKLETLKPSMLYNLGRVISYTVIGGIVGALGAVFNLSLTAQGWIQLLGGGFMIIMGLNLLNLFPILRKLNPRIPKFLAFKVRKSKRGKGPLYVGLANGLMPCGPLQAMQLFALATGSPVLGALSMFVFSLGTVPLMFLIGAISSFLSKKFATKMVMVGAFLVLVMGASMLNRGLMLTGIDLFASETTSGIVAEVVGDVQYVQTTMTDRWAYDEITVHVGIPVVWTFYVPHGMLTGCNNAIAIPEWNIELPLSVGANIIEFTPTETGSFPYMCWMAMIRSQITVIE